MGLFMYLTENQIKKLLANIKNNIGGYNLIFDAYSVLTAKKAKSHPSIKKTGEKILWGIDDPKELNKLNSHYRIMFKITNLFSFIKNAHRILVYNIKEKFS